VQQAFFDSACSFAKDMEFNGSIESRVESRSSFIGLYGGLFFLGIFLGVLFIMVTVLIIYYKQISEGYEDRERFIIMQKVGMTKSEVKSAIRSQVLMVFFLPLLMAGIHVAAAFPLITLLLELMNMVNVHLYLTCTAICFLIFAAVYVLIYSLTARTYYRIVSIK
jgi:putative ABC transport system permease protein